jgi:hypothetical protein
VVISSIPETWFFPTSAIVVSAFILAINKDRRSQRLPPEIHGFENLKNLIEGIMTNRVSIVKMRTIHFRQGINGNGVEFSVDFPKVNSMFRLVKAPDFRVSWG